jgi:nucleoside-diphosphate-sugar epimerase
LIGSAITARLISAGHNVFGLARNVKEEPKIRDGILDDARTLGLR